MAPSLSQLFTVVSRGRTNATPHPLTKLGYRVGIEPRSPEYQPRVVTTWRLWSIRVGLGRISVIRIHVIMHRCHRYCDPSLFLKYCHKYCDSSLILKIASRLFSVFWIRDVSYVDALFGNVSNYRNQNHKSVSSDVPAPIRLGWGKNSVFQLAKVHLIL